MAYNANIPQPNDFQDESQPQILANFQALEPFGNGYADLAALGGTPTFSGTNNGIFSLVNGTTTKNELYLHKQNNAGSENIPFTASKMSNTAKASCTSGWSYLPSGLLIKWGRYQAPNSNIFTVPVNSLSAGPVYTNQFQVLLTAEWGGSVTASPSVPVLSAKAVTTAGNFNCFVTNFDATKSYLNYIVIGV